MNDDSENTDNETEIESQVVKVEELKPNTKNIILTAKVVELSEIRTVFNRKHNSEHSVMDILIGDDSGVVLFSAWNEDIEKYEVGKTYIFENAKTILFRRNIRLSLGKYGSSNSHDDIDEVNTENNLSEQEHETYRRFDNRGPRSRDPWDNQSL
jgi:ssDNA-binding replication factor A large subunit